MVVIKITRCLCVYQWTILSRGEFGYSLGAFRYSMLGQLSREDEPDSSLDLTGGDSRLLVVASQLCSLRGNFVEDVVDERVQN